MNPAADKQGGSQNAQSEAEKELLLKLLTTKVFFNELIWKNLGTFLNTSDLKCCRLVNRKFNRMVMDETNFRNRVVLRVKMENLTEEGFGQTLENWKKVSLKFPVVKVSNPSNYSWLFPLLEQVNFLSLRLQKHKKSGCTAIIDGHPTFGMLLSSCKKLSSLAIEPGFIRLGSGGIFSGSKTLKNLKQLEILEPNYNWFHFNRPSFSDANATQKENRIVKEFCDELTHVETYKSYFVEVNGGKPYDNQANDPQVYQNVLQNMSEIQTLQHICDRVISNNREHLQSHPFCDIFQVISEEELLLLGWDQQESYYGYHETPALKYLQANATSQLRVRAGNFPGGTNWKFLDYFNSRPPLVQIEISYPTSDPATAFQWPQVIQALWKHAGSLKILKIQADLLQNVDWKLLRHSNLTDVRLEDMRGARRLGPKSVEKNHNGWIHQVLLNLPETVRRIYLKGAEGLKVKTKLKPSDFVQLDPTLVEQLTIFNAGDAFTNELAAFVCKNFKMLRKLNLSDTKTDDSGFRGISHLKGLQFLTLRRCRISNKTLKDIVFKELRYLDISGNRKVTLGGIQMAMRQCPSLETLIVSAFKTKFTKDDGQKVCPRLKFLIARDEMGH